jgi:hypothetical protein
VEHIALGVAAAKELYASLAKLPLAGRTTP